MSQATSAPIAPATPISSEEAVFNTAYSIFYVAIVDAFNTALLTIGNDHLLATGSEANKLGLFDAVFNAIGGASRNASHTIQSTRPKMDSDNWPKNRL